MKKLLALVLCVMMFVSVVPTSAFAGNPDGSVDNPLYTVSQYNTQIKNMIKNTKKNVESAYKALVGDQVVYTSAKTMDDAIVDLVNGIADPLIAKDKFTKAKADTVKDSLRSYFDTAVAKKISDNLYKAYDKDGVRDDLKYAQVVANAISDAMTDKNFVAGYRAVATYFALANVVSDIHDNLKDARDEFIDSIDSKFQADFAAKYTTLVDDYIDTIATGALKAANNEAAYAVLEAGLIPLDTARTTAINTAKTNRTAAYTAATTAYNTAVTNAETAVTNAETTLLNDKVTLANDQATLANLKATLPAGDPQIVAQEAVVAADQAQIATDEAAIGAAEAALITAKANATTTYNKAIAAADDVYKYDVAAADATYDAGALPLFDAYDQAYDVINPWAWGDYRLSPPVGSWN